MTDETISTLSDVDGSGAPPVDTDQVYLSDFKKRKKVAKKVEDDIYPNTVVLTDEDDNKRFYANPHTDRLDFDPDDCDHADDLYECTVCGVRLRYCKEHETVHCGCQKEYEDGQRLSSPLRYRDYNPGICRFGDIPELRKCSVCGTQAPVCKTHTRIHCGCNEAETRWGR